MAVVSYSKSTYRDIILYGRIIYCLMRFFADHTSHSSKIAKRQSETAILSGLLDLRYFYSHNCERSNPCAQRALKTCRVEPTRS